MKTEVIINAIANEFPAAKSTLFAENIDILLEVKDGVMSEETAIIRAYVRSTFDFVYYLVKKYKSGNFLVVSANSYAEMKLTLIRML